MREYRLNDFAPGSECYEAILSSIKRNRLVPFIGSGFSAGLPTRNGCVPSPEQLKRKLAELLRKFGEISSLEEAELLKLDFYSAADFFMRKCADREADTDVHRNLKKEFKRYVVSNFIGVNSLPTPKAAFLSCEWPYLYTLNYDDAIELALNDYDKIVPYRSLDKDWLVEERHCLIKLHGDAREYQISDDFRYFIMGKSQYMSAIDRDENRHLMDWLRDDFASKDILFIGCGLNDELDILFAGRRANKISDPSRQTVYYALYDKNPTGEVSFATKAKLEGYGIGCIVRVAPEEWNRFYSLIADMHEKARSTTDEDELALYRGFTFAEASSSPKENLGFLFSNAPLGIGNENKRVTLPRFHVTRDVEHAILADLTAGCPISLVMGNRFAGKSYVLLGLLMALRNEREDVYFFAGTSLSDAAVSVIKRKKNCVLLFDSGALTGEQIRDDFCKDIQALKEREVQAVFAVSTSEKGFFFGLKDEVNEVIAAGCRMHILDAKLSDGERRRFQRRADELHFARRRKDDTFIDYAMRVEANELTSSVLDSSPELLLLSRDNQDMVVCLIALAMRTVIDVSEANRLDVQQELLDLCSSTNGIVQQDFLSFLEARGKGHAGTKYVSNSLYWISRCLSEYATDPSNYDSIARAFASIAARIEKGLSSRSKTLYYYRLMMPFILFDNIQDIFFCGSSARESSMVLPEMIYDRLSPLLYGDFQFLHQHAKCKLRSSRRVAPTQDREAKLEEAKRLVEKALELAAARGGENVMYTLTHMNVTKVLILTNYLRYCCESEAPDVEALNQAIAIYHDIYVENRRYNDLKYASRDRGDILWFFENLVKPESAMLQCVTDDELRIETQEAVSAYYDRKVSIEWDD